VQQVANPSKSCELVANLIDQSRHVEIEKSGSQLVRNPKKLRTSWKLLKLLFWGTNSEGRLNNITKDLFASAKKVIEK
jgi:hypothetical protein